MQRKARKIDPLRAPWEEGYRFAAWLRDALGLNGRIAGTLSGIWELLGLESRALEEAVITPVLPDEGQTRGMRFYDAMLAVNAAGGPGFVIEKQHETSRTFAFCRALFEYLTTEPGPPVLVSPAISERQKRNRAFAAEFLAPADLLRSQLPGEVLDPSDVQELADFFSVSFYVIAHQLENHRLARMAAL
jgi:hypothetical protein